MNILKHMEVVFIAAVVIAGSASYLAEAVPLAKAALHTIDPAAIGTSSKMAVVTVSAKRLSHPERQGPLLAQRQKTESRM